MTTTNTTTHFPVKAGRGTKVHWYTQHTWTNEEGETRTSGQTACNVTLTNKAWSNKGGTAHPNFQIQPGEVAITCERCLKALAAQAEAEAATELPVESTGDLVHTEPAANEFSFHFLFGLPDYTDTRKEWRKLVRAIIKDQNASYTIEDGHYTVTLESGFVYSFSRDDSGATYIDRE